MLGIQAQQGLGAKVQNAASELSPALTLDAEGDADPALIRLPSSGCGLVLLPPQSSGARGSEPRSAGRFPGKWFRSPKEQGAVQSGAGLALSVVGLWPLWQRPVGFQNPCWRFREKWCSGQWQGSLKGKEGFRNVGPEKTKNIHTSVHTHSFTWNEIWTRTWALLCPSPSPCVEWRGPCEAVLSGNAAGTPDLSLLQAGGSTGLLMDLAANEKAVHSDFFNDFEDLFDDDDIQ
uniref:COP9 signalosome complex subunit 9 n=1 Tax=Myotis myotis TaxID=51298 RepID=A0A7J7WGM3_MYOMY|nr:COP9 signalosome subunit 9 [Myotis myotis]